MPSQCTLKKDRKGFKKKIISFTIEESIPGSKPRTIGTCQYDLAELMNDSGGRPVAVERQIPLRVGASWESTLQVGITIQSLEAKEPSACSASSGPKRCDTAPLPKACAGDDVCGGYTPAKFPDLQSEDQIVTPTAFAPVEPATTETSPVLQVSEQVSWGIGRLGVGEQALALAAVAVNVGECGELIVTKGTVGKIFDLRKNGENGTVKNGVFRPIFSNFSPIVVPFYSTTSRHKPPQPASRVLYFPIFPPVFPHFPSVFSIFPHVPPFSPFSAVFQTPKPWFGELVSW